MKTKMFQAKAGFGIILKKDAKYCTLELKNLDIPNVKKQLKLVKKKFKIN